MEQPWTRSTFLAGLSRWSAPPYEPFTRNVAAPTHPPSFLLPPPQQQATTTPISQFTSHYTKASTATTPQNSISHTSNPFEPAPLDHAPQDTPSSFPPRQTPTPQAQAVSNTEEPLTHTTTAAGGVLYPPGWTTGVNNELSGLVVMLARARRGLLVVGEQSDPGEVVAAARLAEALGWPVAADVLSGE